MALKPQLSLRQSQTLALTPTMRTSLAVLRMSAAELDELALSEASRNPFLLLDPRPAGPPLASAAASAEAALVAGQGSFHEALAHQIGLMALEDEVAALARLLIGELREDGILDTPLAELSESWQVPFQVLETALEAIQRCEPAGVGARDLRECLTLQLVDIGLDHPQAVQTVSLLPLFASGDWSAIRRQMGITRAEAQERAAMLRRLTPHPVQPQDLEQPPPALPDLVLERLPGGAMQLGPARPTAPMLRIDEALAARSASDGFAADLLQRARSVIDAMAQRGRTLARIGEWLLENQTGFLLHGPSALRPVTRAELAHDLGLHPSTIGRAVTGKHVDIDGQLWPLARFFSTALASSDGPVSAFTLQQRIAGMVGTEAFDAPLSDKDIADKLRAEGVDIARRTVAKYRQALRIPGSAARRRQARLSRRQPGQNGRRRALTPTQ